MSHIEFFSGRDVAATRKPQTCAACERQIAKGQPAKHYAVKVEGDFYNTYYHPDCRDAESHINLSAGLNGDEYTDLWFLYEERDDAFLVPDGEYLVATLRQKWPAVLNRLEERDQARASQQSTTQGVMKL